MAAGRGRRHSDRVPREVVFDEAIRRRQGSRMAAPGSPCSMPSPCSGREAGSGGLEGMHCMAACAVPTGWGLNHLRIQGFRPQFSSTETLFFVPVSRRHYIPAAHPALLNQTECNGVYVQPVGRTGSPQVEIWNFTYSCQAVVKLQGVQWLDRGTGSAYLSILGDVKKGMEKRMAQFDLHDFRTLPDFGKILL